MNKTDRQIVFDKYGGRCAYCGCELEENWKAVNVDRVGIAVADNGDLFTKNNTIENKYPSCMGCFRRRVECSKDCQNNPTDNDFRRYLKHSFGFLQSNPYYENAIRYGQLVETGIEIKFYHETFKKQ